MQYLITEEGHKPQQMPGESSVCFWMVVVVGTQAPGTWYMSRSSGIREFKSLPFLKTLLELLRGFPGSSDGKVSACNAGNLGLVPGSMEKEMVTHSSTLAWKIPWTEEPARLQSTGSQRDRHD